MTALHALTAGELLAGYRAGRFSPLEVAQAVVSIASLPPGVSVKEALVYRPGS